MEDQMGTVALTKILPPDLGADEQIDWSAAQTRWGTRFPNDYMAFMSVYGGGELVTADGFGGLVILMPLPKASRFLNDQTFGEETENARDTWEMVGGQEGLDIDPQDILAWGVTSGPDILCWLTTDPDPDQWPVLVCGRHTDKNFTLFPCGMVEFLRGLILDEHDPYPISIDLRDRSLHYLHRLEIEKR
ncbi:SMI1/KNR4 family protein [Nocardia brasiliensis]|uniref:SMI1/KNR4 family protein n=1 Tax=Nocardia brasiliensis TaxID=37326 RepID=UPI0024589FDC|nr:SMI1/KNR4 family protein [Nocardia brasiliensis]